MRSIIETWILIGGSIIIGSWYWCTDQYIVQRVLSGRDMTQARRGAIFGGYLKITPVFIFLVPGMIAYAMAEQGLLDLSGGANTAFPVMVRELLPAGIKGVVLGGAIAALMGAAVDWKELDIHAAEEMTAERFAVALGLLINAAVLKTRFAQAHLTGFLAIGAIAVHLIWLVNVPHVGAHLPSYTGVLPINVMLTFLLSGLMFRRAIWVVAGALVAYSTALLLNHLRVC